MLMPDIFTMQEIIRTAFDYHTDDTDNGMETDIAFIFAIDKGTILYNVRSKMSKD